MRNIVEQAGHELIRAIEAEIEAYKTKVGAEGRNFLQDMPELDTFNTAVDDFVFEDSDLQDNLTNIESFYSSLVENAEMKESK